MTAPQRLFALAVLVVVAMTTGLSTYFLQLQTALPLAEPPPEVLVRDVDTAVDGVVSVAWAGDTMLGDAAQPLLDARGYGWPLTGVAPLLAADVTIINAEAPITALTEPWDPDKQFSYHMLPAAAAALEDAGIDAVSLANNHVMDRGPWGLTDTQRTLEAVGVQTFGAGQDADEARRPLLLRSSAGTLAVVGFGEDFGADSRAGRDDPGIAQLTRRAIREAHDTARAAGAEHVLAFVHWGDNYSDIVAKQRYWAAELVHAGYDLVVGAGPHIAQAVAVIDDVPVVYSLGNFVFGAPGRFERSDRLGLGLVLVTDFAPTGTTLRMRCIATDNDVVQYQPQPCDPGQAAAVLPFLHPDAQLTGDTAVLTVPKGSAPPA